MTTSSSRRSRFAPLLALLWFAQWHNRFIMFKNHLIDQVRARLGASAALTRVRRSIAVARRVLRRLRCQLRPSVPFGSRHATRSARALRRFVWLWRHRRKAGGSERP